MTDNTPRLRIPELVSMQEANCVTWNEALVQLDAFVDLYLLGQGTNTPPGSPADGEAYLVGGSPTGAWSGYASKIAYCIDGAWRFYTPFNGLRAYVATTGAFVVYLNGTWTDWNSLISANEVSIASAATCDLGAANSLFVQITGTTAIASFGTGANKLRFVRFADALTLTHNATSLILAGGASIATAAGDTCIVSSDGSGNWRVRHYQPAGSALWGQPEATLASAATVDLGSVNAHRVQITGTTTITSFGTSANRLKYVRFAGALTLTHNATSLILLGGASRTTAANDIGLYESDTSGNWRERGYFRAAANPGDYATRTGTETLTNKTLGAATLPGGGSIGSAGNLTLGSGAKFAISVASPQYGIDVSTQGVNFGGDIGSYATRTNSTNKAGFFSVPVYNTGVSPLLVMSAVNYSAGNDLYFGGGSGSYTAATSLQFYTASAVDTVTGTARLKIDGSGNVSIGSTSAVGGALLDVNGNIYPHTDNTYNLGSAFYRFGTVYAGTGTINTSGAETKTNIAALSDAELAVAKALAANVRVFRFCDAVARKGDGARLHAGMIYEDVAAAFAAEGLDPERYAIVCRDPAMTAVGRRRVVTNDAGVSVEEDFEEMVPDVDQTGAPKWILGLRYDELAQFVMAGLAARLAALEAA